MGLIDFMSFDISPFKEPRGFLKLLQWLFAIFAFATVVDFSTQVSFDVRNISFDSCPANQTVYVSKQINYPFTLDNPSEADIYPLRNCSSAKPSNLKVKFPVNAGSESRFFVFTGVMAFLYATGMILVHLYKDKMYMETNTPIMVDFIITVIFSVFWLSGTIAWCAGVSEIREKTSPRAWSMDDRAFEPPTKGMLENVGNINPGSYGTLTVSYLFGFINFIVWATNLWFLYKETAWFESIVKRTATSNVAAGSPTV